jgi:hypothetical protein
MSMGMQWIKADGTSQTWNDEPAQPATKAPTPAAWRWCDRITLAILAGSVAAFFSGVFS